MNKMSKNIKLMDVERIVKEVCNDLRKRIVEDEKRYHTHKCDCGRAWALEKPHIIISPNVHPRVLRVPARERVPASERKNGSRKGKLLYDENGMLVMRNISRKQTACFCGKPFMLGLKPYPTIHIDDLCGDAKQPTKWGPWVLRALEALAVKRKATNGKTE